jgi:hypothetical protein
MPPHERFGGPPHNSKEQRSRGTIP